MIGLIGGVSSEILGILEQINNVILMIRIGQHETKISLKCDNSWVCIINMFKEIKFFHVQMKVNFK